MRPVLVIRSILPVLLLSTLTLTGCGGGSENSIRPLSESRLERLNEEQLYSRARRTLEASNNQSALSLYAELEARYPFSEYARQAQLESIYAHYRSFSEDAAIATADRFITQYPRHPNVDYAHYLKGVANFSRATPDIGSLLTPDASSRDPGYTREAFFTFANLLNRFPDSRYAPDARQRMVFLRERLARHDWQVGAYYLRKGAWLAVVNRARFVLERYQGTQTLGEALLGMAQAYRQLQLDPLADNALRIYEETFPNGHQVAKTPGPLAEPGLPQLAAASR